MPVKHSIFEDVFALSSAAVFVAFGIFLFNSQGILTGGTAGIALVLSHLCPLNFGAIFFLINVPFYYLAWRQMGIRFAINTFISVSVVSLMAEYMGQVIVINVPYPLFSGVFGGLLIGMGMLIMFRHQSSLGGSGILAFYLQNKYNIRAGKFQLVVDCLILSTSYFWQILSFVNLYYARSIAEFGDCVNHKPGRYKIT